MATVTWQESALDEVEDIRRGISHDSLQAAATFVREVFPATDQLELFPLIGRVVPEFGLDDVREVIFRRRYRIVYRAYGQETVDVLAVRDGRRPLGDIPGL